MPRIHEASVVQQTFAVATRLLIADEINQPTAGPSSRPLGKDTLAACRTMRLSRGTPSRRRQSSITSFDRHALQCYQLERVRYPFNWR
jgi:hypothetical protein